MNLSQNKIDFNHELFGDFAVSVVLPTYNSGRTIKKCLEAIAKSSIQIKELIVVDGYSTDNTVETANRFGAHIVFEKKHNIATARNRGVNEATGDVIIFVDSDCIVAEDCLRDLCSVLISSESVAGAGGIAYPYSNDIISESFAVRFFDYVPSKEKSIREVSSIATMIVAYKREVLIQAGGFDEDMAPTGEDLDLNIRLIKKGYKLLLVPSAVAWHDHPSSLTGLVKKWFDYGIGLFKVCKKHRTYKEIVMSTGWVMSSSIFLIASLWNIYFLLLFLMVFITPWLIYYSRPSLEYFVQKREIKTFLFPFIHQVVILSRSLGVIYAFLVENLRMD